MNTCTVRFFGGLMVCDEPAAAKLAILCRNCKRRKDDYICAEHYERRAKIRCSGCYEFTLVYSEPVTA